MARLQPSQNEALNFPPSRFSIVPDKQSKSCHPLKWRINKLPCCKEEGEP
jgi:hypothetical protein